MKDKKLIVTSIKNRKTFFVSTCCFISENLRWVLFTRTTKLWSVISYIY